jgi:transcriptional regulator with XRE-family HTH domain
MTKATKLVTSKPTQEALRLLGSLIQIQRKTKKMTVEELAQRAGISRSLLVRIEKGDPKCSIGAVFEVAVLVEVSLFDPDPIQTRRMLQNAQEKISLLPERIRKPLPLVNDDF